VWRLLRQYFLTGLFALLPVVVTLYIGYRIFLLLDAAGQFVGVKWPGFGVLITLILITIFGLLVSNILGQQIVKLYEWVFQRVPVLRSVYDAVKQLVTTFADTKHGAFQSVVLVPYGGGAGRSLAFVVRDQSVDGKVAVFLPWSPPTAGFLILFPPEDIQPTDLTVEEAMKILLSGGTLLPDGGTILNKGSAVE
jgi:uncharacterized membrane protein